MVEAQQREDTGKLRYPLTKETVSPQEILQVQAEDLKSARLLYLQSEVWPVLPLPWDHCKTTYRPGWPAPGPRRSLARTGNAGDNPWRGPSCSPVLPEAQ